MTPPASRRTPPPPPSPPPPPQWTGYAPAPATMVPTVAAKPGTHRRLFVWLAAGVGAVVLLVVIVALVATPSPKKNCRPPTCGGQPPTGQPIRGDQTYTSTAYGFTMDYFHYGGIEEDVTPSADSLQIDFPDLRGYGAGRLLVTARKAGGADARSIVSAVAGDAFPGAKEVYPLPGAAVGYRPGYGVAYDYFPQSANGTAERERVFVLAAVKNDLAIVAIASSPYFQFTPDGLTTGHPSAANAAIAFVADDAINTIRWSDDPPR